MSIDPINPGYLDHIFAGAISQPREIAPVNGQNERERSDSESEQRRRGEREEFDSVLVDAEGRHDGTDRGNHDDRDAYDERGDDDGIETDQDDANESPDADGSGQDVQDAVVVELDDKPPSREERIERRQQPSDPGHIDFEA